MYPNDRFLSHTRSERSRVAESLGRTIRNVVLHTRLRINGEFIGLNEDDAGK
jgi:hypothetical protein